jgi:NNP family nitrate/nitrite transporter-like MFS transporter
MQGAKPVVTSAQQTRALTLSTVAFTACFAVWTVFAIIGIQIKQNLGLTETQFGLLVGTPILTGSLSRTGGWTSCFMLLFLIVLISFLWMHAAIVRQ